MSAEPPPPDKAFEPPPGPAAVEISAAKAIMAQYVRERVGPSVSPVDAAFARRFRSEHIDQMYQYLTLREQNRHVEAREQTRTLP